MDICEKIQVASQKALAQTGLPMANTFFDPGGQRARFCRGVGKASRQDIAGGQDRAEACRRTESVSPDSATRGRRIARLSRAFGWAVLARMALAVERGDGAGQPRSALGPTLGSERGVGAALGAGVGGSTGNQSGGPFSGTTSTGAGIQGSEHMGGADAMALLAGDGRREPGSGRPDSRRLLLLQARLGLA